MKSYLMYELAPYPLWLFNDNGFKKNVKSELYKDFTNISDLPNAANNVIYVIDGGFLLHKVIWQKNDSVNYY